MCNTLHGAYIAVLYLCICFHRQDVTEVYPVSRIEQEVREQKDMFGSLDLHETYYKVCKCNYIMHTSYPLDSM